MCKWDFRIPESLDFSKKSQASELLNSRIPESKKVNHFRFHEFLNKYFDSPEFPNEIVFPNSKMLMTKT